MRRDSRRPCPSLRRPTALPPRQSTSSVPCSLLEFTILFEQLDAEANRSGSRPPFSHTPPRTQNNGFILGRIEQTEDHPCYPRLNRKASPQGPAEPTGSGKQCVPFRAPREPAARISCPCLGTIQVRDKPLMRTNNPIESADLERREYQLSLFACSAIVVLAGGLALLMYPAVFANKENTTS